MGHVHAPGDCVCHGVSIPLDLGDLIEVAVVLTVHARQAAQVGRGMGRQDGALVVAGDRSRVVVEGGEGALPQVKGGVGDIGLGQDSSLLQVAVGDVTEGGC